MNCPTNTAIDMHLVTIVFVAVLVVLVVAWMRGNRYVMGRKDGSGEE